MVIRYILALVKSLKNLKPNGPNLRHKDRQFFISTLMQLAVRLQLLVALEVCFTGGAENKICYEPEWKFKKLL